MAPADFTHSETLGQLLVERASGPQGPDLRFLHVSDDDLPPDAEVAGEDRCLTLSYADLLALGRRGAACLAERGVGEGDRVLILLATGPTFLAAFYGCQILGAVPVPVIPPVSLARLDAHLARITGIARACRAKALAADPRILPVLGLLSRRERAELFPAVVRGRDLLARAPSPPEPREVDPGATAMIQFTSGSTGTPKGVVLSHRNLLANIRGIGVAAEFLPEERALTWLPLFHDMGLIGHPLTGLAWRKQVVLMPPEVFLRRPAEWLAAISRYRATCSAGPNFAFEYCVRRIADADLAGVDLSSWHLAYCGAELVRPGTLERFTRRFEPWGFRASSLFPVYGMAEFTLAASFPPPGDPPRIDRIDRRRFEDAGIADPVAGPVADPGTEDAGRPEAEVLAWVSVGRVLPGHRLRVVDAEGEPVGERREGEIELAGPSRMAGYYSPDGGADEATAEAIRDGWLRTGDRGYLAGGDLFVTGRTKEMILKAGRNLYPQDVEAAAARVSGVRAGCCAAFGVADPERGTEELVLVCETRRRGSQARSKLRARVRAEVLAATGSAPDRVAMVDPGTVPKTSAGKIQRHLVRQRYLAGDLVPGRPGLFTLFRLGLARLGERLRSRLFVIW